MRFVFLGWEEVLRVGKVLGLSCASSKFRLFFSIFSKILYSLFYFTINILKSNFCKCIFFRIKRDLQTFYKVQNFRPQVCVQGCSSLFHMHCKEKKNACYWFGFIYFIQTPLMFFVSCPLLYYWMCPTSMNSAYNV